MIRSLTIGATALVLFGSSMASAQYVPGSDATSRADATAERLHVAAGDSDAPALLSNARTTSFGYPAIEQRGARVPGSDANRRRAEEDARASVQGTGAVRVQGAFLRAF